MTLNKVHPIHPLFPLQTETHKTARLGGGLAVYPYRTRVAWLVGNRYAHFIRALDQRRSIQDSVLEARVDAMRFWNQVRFFVLILLSLGLGAAGGAWIVRFMPAFEAAVEVVGTVAATASYISGALTLAYLFVLRLLGQLEADILTILTLRDDGKRA